MENNNSKKSLPAEVWPPAIINQAAQTKQNEVNKSPHLIVGLVSVCLALANDTIALLDWLRINGVIRLLWFNPDTLNRDLISEISLFLLIVSLTLGIVGRRSWIGKAGIVMTLLLFIICLLPVKM